MSATALSPHGPFDALALYDPPVSREALVALAWDQPNGRFIPQNIVCHGDTWRSLPRRGDPEAVSDEQ